MLITRFLSAPLVIAALAVFLGTLVDALVKGIAPTAGLVYLLAWRYFFGAILSGGIFFALDRPMPSWEAVRFHIFRGLLQLFGASTFFYALTQLPLALATTLGFTAALLVAPIARVLLGEKISPVTAGATLIGFVGVAVALTGQSSSGPEGGNLLLGLVAVFTATISYGFILVLLRMRATKEDATTISMFTNVVPAIALLPVTLGGFGFPDLQHLPLFALLGLIGYSVWYLMTLAYARAPAQRIAPLEYTSLIWAALLGWAFFQEVPGWQLWVGAAIIIAACLLVAFEAHFRTRRETGQPASDLPD